MCKALDFVPGMLHSTNVSKVCQLQLFSEPLGSQSPPLIYLTLYSLGCPQPRDLPAVISWAPGLQVHAITSSFSERYFLFFIRGHSYGLQFSKRINSVPSRSHIPLKSTLYNVSSSSSEPQTLPAILPEPFQWLFTIFKELISSLPY